MLIVLEIYYLLSFLNQYSMNNAAITPIIPPSTAPMTVLSELLGLVFCVGATGTEAK